MPASFNFRSRILALICASFVVFPLAAAPKAPIEKSLADMGKLYDAAQLIESKAAKDAEAQKRAAELYLKLALYDKAADRFKAGGMSEAAANEAVMASALEQAHRATAYRYAKALGRDAEIAARFAELELAAGRGAAALVWARASGGAALVDRAGKAAFDWTVSAPGKSFFSEGETGYNCCYGPDGRFLVVKPGAYSDLRVVDLQAPRAADGLAPIRTVGAAANLTSDMGYVTSTVRPLKAWAVDPEGCVLALYLRVPDPKSPSQQNPKTYKSNGPHVYQLRLERIDNGLEIRTVTLGKNFADADDNEFSVKTRLLFYAGDDLCLSFGEKFLLFDPFTGTAAVNTAKTIPAAYGSSNNPPAGYATKASIDYEAALALAKEFKLMDRFAALAAPLLASGNLEKARFVMVNSGKSEADIALAYGDYYASRKDDKAAVEWYVKAGDVAKVKALIDGRIAAANYFDMLKTAYIEGLASYAAVGLDPKSLHLAVARLYEEWSNYAEAADCFVAAGASDEAQRIAFDPKAIKSYMDRKPYDDAEKWCMPVAKKAGMSDERAALLMAAYYEGAGNRASAAEWFIAGGDKKSARRIALERAAEGDIEGAVELAESIGKDVVAEVYRVAADERIAAREYDEAVEWLKKLGDGPAVAKLGDVLYKAGDLFSAASYYSAAKSLGWRAESANAKDAIRISTVYDELRQLRRAVNLGDDTLKRINSGEIKQLWPVPKDKLSDAGYAQVAALAGKLAALESKPTSKEAARCATYIASEADAELKRGNYGQAGLDSEISSWMTYFSKYLAAMGR